MSHWLFMGVELLQSVHYGTFLTLPRHFRHRFPTVYESEEK